MYYVYQRNYIINLIFEDKKDVMDIYLGKMNNGFATSNKAVNKDSKVNKKPTILMLVGLQGSGKTTTAEQIANSVLYMAQPDEMQENLNLASIKPALLLKGDTDGAMCKYNGFVGK